MEKNKIGIMQGRLSPPTDGKFQSFPKYTWKDEFYKAEKNGLDNIEWIFEADEWEKNPISSPIGVNEIQTIKSKTNVKTVSLCADYFMDIPYFSCDNSNRGILRDKLEWLVLQSKKIDIKYIDLPFVDVSKIEDQKQFNLVKEFIASASNVAKTVGITIALETNLNPDDFKELLIFINHTNVMANYDTGNSSGIGYKCDEELNSYGKWIRTIHIKDRVLNNGTVPLGTGSADFDLFFDELKALDYSGPIILQATREGDEIQTVKKNIEFVSNYLTKK